MTVEELIEILKKCPQDLPVCLSVRWGEYDELETVHIETIEGGFVGLIANYY